ncbi:MAG: hypothetical protein WCP85_21530 [Mariniphaga sp.]
MKAILKHLFFLVFMVSSVGSLIAQENDFIARLKTQLLLYRTQKMDQSIVIQTDKTLYRQGETIWMKGYVTDAITHLPSLKSLELSVLLTDNKGIVVSEGKFLIKNGVEDYNVLIPSDLPCDNYFLLAFTPETEQAGVQAIFKKEVTIGRPENLDIVPHITFSKPFFTPEQKESATIGLIDLDGKPVAGKKFEYQIINDNRELLSGKGKTDANGKGEIVLLTPSKQKGGEMLVSLGISSGNDQLNLVSKIPLSAEKVNINFFPEGGNLVPGIPQMVIYEATDQRGNPVSLKGEIIDDQGTSITTIATIQQGLGVFTILNDGKTHKLKITSEIGLNQVVQLPSPVPGSMSMTIKKNDGKSISILLGRSPGVTREKFMIAAISNGEITWASDFELEQSGVLNVPLENFRTDIATVGVFSSTGSLLANRLIFAGKGQILNVVLSANKPVYNKGEEGQIIVKITDAEGKPVKAEIAASLSDAATLPASTACINALNYGLVKPLPFKDPLEKVNKIALDYYLAANRLKGFDWNQVLSIDPAKTLNINAQSTRVSGRVIDSKDIPVPSALINLSNSSLQQFNARSNQRGEFMIDLPPAIDRKNLSATATDESGKGNYHVILNKSFKEEVSNSINYSSINEWKILDQLYQSEYFKNNPDFLKATPPVKVKSLDGKNRDPYWKKYLTSSTNMLDIVKTIRNFEMVGTKIVFRGSNSFNAQDGALIVVDGNKLGTDASALTTVNPNDVEDIQILLNPVDMSNYTALNSVGVIVIKTKRGLPPTSGNEGQTANPEDVTLKQFAPKAIGYEKYNLKTTLQWIPVLFTNENGEAKIPFKTGNVKSTFVLEIGGYTDQGRWIGNQTEIKVE